MCIFDLYSPYVSDKFIWSVDGADAENARIALSEIGVGTHEIRVIAMQLHLEKLY